MSKKSHHVGVALTPALESLLGNVLASQLVSTEAKSAIELEVSQGYVTHTSLSVIQTVLNDDTSVFDACLGSKLVFIDHKTASKVPSCLSARAEVC